MKKFLALTISLLLACGNAFATPMVIDSYDKLVAKMNGTTTSFVDSSTATPKTITANGNATQLPIKFNKSAGFFNGTSDYVQVPSSATLDFGTADFTIEAFINITSSADVTMCIASKYDGAGTGWIFKIATGATKTMYLYANDGSNVSVTMASALTPNTWYHVAVRRSSTKIQFYLDGVQVGADQTASASGYNGASGVTNIGFITTVTNYFAGWMKELRISTVARTVSVPTTQYSSDANTVLLMHFDTPATSPLGPSISFDGTGDYLTANSSFNFADGNFTQEFFVKFESTVSAADQVIFAQGTDGNNMAWIERTASSWIFQIYAGGNVITITATSSVSLNTWYHIAVVRNGTSWKVYQNGQEIGTATSSVTYPNHTYCSVGTRYYGSGNDLIFQGGSIKEVRVSNVARYTSAFTPSQTGFVVDSNTKLYIKGDENNGVTTFVDSETTPKTVTTNGDTKIKYTEDYRSCIFKDETGKFPYPVGSAKVDFFAIGSGVGYFDGNGDSISIPYSTDLNFSTGDYTTETFFRANSFASSMALWSIGDYLGSKGVYCFRHSGGYFTLYHNADTVTSPDATIALNALQWYHFAVAREGTSVKFFINGTLFATYTNSTDIDAGATGAWIGTRNDGSTNPYNGLLDNIRISKGVARYTATFNPPDDSESAANSKHRMFQVF